MIALGCYLGAVIGFGLHMWSHGSRVNRREKLEIAVRWWFGAGGLWLLISASGHLFLANHVAGSIGWPTGSPFQREVGFANLALGVMGVLSIWARGTFREATVVGTAIFLWGTAGGHIHEIVTIGNLAGNNAGPNLYMDILGPMVAAVILFLLRRAERRIIR